MSIKKGDNIIVITGKDKGKKGSVVRVFPKIGQVLVEGINVHKKHQKSRNKAGGGTVVDKPFPLNASNVMVVDSKGKRTRMSSKMVGKKKVRVAKKSGTEI